ncbi:MAG TPA: hypothetical protein ENK43_10715 [Planctomycetes bacterium]|nr:hypothetical protein [Planctomycetota bacterium]
MTHSQNDSTKKPARPGSARAKLEAFERQAALRKASYRKVWILGGFLVVALIGVIVFDGMAADTRFVEQAKGLAVLARGGDWKALEEFIAEDFQVEVKPSGQVLDRSALLGLMKRYAGNGIPVYLTYPHRRDDDKDKPSIDAWLIWSREPLSVAANTLPLVRVWTFRAHFEKRGGVWVLAGAVAREAIVDGNR